MAKRDIPRNFDIEIQWADDVFPDIYAAEDQGDNSRSSGGNFFLAYENHIKFKLCMKLQIHTPLIPYC